MVESGLTGSQSGTPLSSGLQLCHRGNDERGFIFAGALQLLSCSNSIEHGVSRCKRAKDGVLRAL
jgi:hypothetical protein